MAQTIAIERVDHIGVRVRDLDRALAFYQVLGFALAHRAVGDDVAIIRNEHGVELNLVFNANAGDPASNILMDVPDKFPGYTHIALRVASIPATIAALRANDIAITRDRSGSATAGTSRCSCATPIATSSSCAAASRASSKASPLMCRETVACRGAAHFIKAA
jgi:lactoylglutathione lyase